jgi:hypothetical protein
VGTPGGPPAPGPPPYAPAVDPDAGKGVQTAGYVVACASLLIPFLGIVSLVLGIITATKPGRGGHGAAIIALSIVLPFIGWMLWIAFSFSSGP